jgi:hypothetical protein
MSEDLTPQATAILADAKWKVHQDIDFGPKLPLRVLVRFLPDVPRDLLDAMLAVLKATTSFTGTLTEGKDYAGTWAQGHAWWSRQQKVDDNTITIWQLLVTGPGAEFDFSYANSSGGITIKMLEAFTQTAVQSVLDGLGSGDSNSVSLSYDREQGLFSGMVHIKNESNMVWDAAGPFSEWQTHEFTDHEGTHWLYKDEIGFSVRAGLIIASGHEFFSGGHKDGHFEQYREQNAWFFKRVVKIDRTVFTVGGVDSTTGMWNPGTPAQVGASFNIFTATSIPWGP